MTTMPVTSPPRGTGGLRGPGGLRMTPGRWVALLFGVPVALALIAWTGFSFVSGIGQASFPVNTTFGVQGGRLAASLGGGDFTVRQDRDLSGRARLTGTVQYSLIRPRLVVSAGGVSLHCRLLTGNCGLSGTLDVPPGTAVDLTSGGGNLEVNGLASDITLDSGGGDVNASALFSPHVTMDSGGGNVTLVFTTPPVSLNITSDGGDVTVVLPHGSTRYAITHNADGGDYSAPVPTGSSSRHTISVQSGGGNISITEAS
jgi:hypothetical protein